MKTTLTIYELLGLIKNNKAPKKIKFCGNIYEWEDDWYLTKEKNYKVCLGGKKEDCNILINAFNDNVEIIDEEEFEDIEENNDILRFDDMQFPYGRNEEKFMKYIIIYQKKINQLIKNQKKIIEKLNKSNNTQ